MTANECIAAAILVLPAAPALTPGGTASGHVENGEAVVVANHRCSSYQAIIAAVGHADCAIGSGAAVSRLAVDGGCPVRVEHLPGSARAGSASSWAMARRRSRARRMAALVRVVRQGTQRGQLWGMS